MNIVKEYFWAILVTGWFFCYKEQYKQIGRRI